MLFFLCSLSRSPFDVVPRGRSQTISYPVKPPQHYRNATHDLHSPFRPGSSSLSEPRTAYLNSRAYKVRIG